MKWTQEFSRLPLSIHFLRPLQATWCIYGDCAKVAVVFLNLSNVLFNQIDALQGSGNHQLLQLVRRGSEGIE